MLKKVYQVMAWGDDGDMFLQTNDEVSWLANTSAAVRHLLDAFIQEGIVDTEADFELISIDCYWTLFGKQVTPRKNILYFDAYPDQD